MFLFLFLFLFLLFLFLFLYLFLLFLFLFLFLLFLFLFLFPEHCATAGAPPAAGPVGSSSPRGRLGGINLASGAHVRY